MSAPAQISREQTRVGIATVAKFFSGDSGAILKIAAASPGMLGIGALFVLSAALAREYDGADLLAEPWHLLLPMAASLATSCALFSLVFAVGKARGIGNVPFGPTYLRFLNLYWMTAPLAWLYAIPVESFMTPLHATVTNLLKLGIVSVGRVWLMTRVVRSLVNCTAVAAWSVVLLFADVVALAAIVVVPKPVISIMGGISHTDAEIAILNATFIVGFACVLSLPIWVIATVVAAVHGKKWHLAICEADERHGTTRGLRALAAASVVIWALLLPITQPQQRLARRVDNELRAGSISDAIADMAAHQRSDFPPRWDPPPHIGYGERNPSALDVMEVIVATDPPVWIRSMFVAKFGNTLYNTALLWQGRGDDEKFGRYVRVLQKLPEGPSFAWRKQAWISMAYNQPGLSEARREGLKALLDLAKTYDPDKHPADDFARPF